MSKKIEMSVILKIFLSLFVAVFIAVGATVYVKSQRTKEAAAKLAQEEAVERADEARRLAEEEVKRKVAQAVSRRIAEEAQRSLNPITTYPSSSATSIPQVGLEGAIRHVDNIAGTQEVLQQGVWRTVSTPEAKAKRAQRDAQEAADMQQAARQRAEMAQDTANEQNPPIECRYGGRIGNEYTPDNVKRYREQLVAAATRECLSNLKAAKSGNPQSFLALDRYKAHFEAPQQPAPMIIYRSR